MKMKFVKTLLYTTLFFVFVNCAEKSDKNVVKRCCERFCSVFMCRNVLCTQPTQNEDDSAIVELTIEENGEISEILHNKKDE